jgi:hypothetical protein
MIGMKPKEAALAKRITTTIAVPMTAAERDRLEKIAERLELSRADVVRTAVRALAARMARDHEVAHEVAELIG